MDFEDGIADWGLGRRGGVGVWICVSATVRAEAVEYGVEETEIPQIARMGGERRRCRVVDRAYGLCVKSWLWRAMGRLWIIG